MVEAAGPLRLASAGAGVDRWVVGDEGEKAGASPSDGDAAEGGDSGSAGGVDSSEEDKAITLSRGAGEHGSASSGKGPGGQGDEAGKEGVDGEEGDGEVVQRSGERRSSFVFTSLLNSSNSLRRFLVFLAGGDVTSGDREVAGGLGGEGAGDGVQAFPLSGVATAGPGIALVWAEMIGDGWRAGLAPSVRVARPRRQRQWRRRRRLAAVATAVMDGRGKLQVTVVTCVSAAWLKIMQVLSLLARQRSYNAEKSAVEIAARVLVQAGCSTLSRTTPLTTLAHVVVGEIWEVGGWGGGGRR